MTIPIRQVFKGLFRRCECGNPNCLIPVLNKKGKFQKFKHGHNSVGCNHNMWNGGEYPTYEGYIVCYAPNHPFKNSRNCVYKHRLIYEHYLKILFDEDIYIPKGIDIHHINGDIQDNSLINIEPLTRSYHGSLSGKEGKGIKKTKGKKKTKRKYR